MEIGLPPGQKWQGHATFCIQLRHEHYPLMLGGTLSAPKVLQEARTNHAAPIFLPYPQLPFWYHLFPFQLNYKVKEKSINEHKIQQPATRYLREAA